MPRYLLYLLPFLLCPLGMGVMRWIMMRGMNGSQQTQQPMPTRQNVWLDARLGAGERIAQR